MRSILIKGMEMPTSCGYCPLRHKARDGDECYLGASLTEYQKRPDDCPLVPVPAHGRLIDADALINNFEFSIKHCTIKGHTAQRYREMIVELSVAPTIIPAEEV